MAARPQKGKEVPKFVKAAHIKANPATYPTQMPPDDEEEEDRLTETTFSSIVSPPLEEQDAALQKNPIMSQPVAQPRQFRRVKSGQVDVTYALNKVFGKASFKGKQKEIMEAAVKGQDILVVAPTGMGKSLCFQVPAVAEEHGLTVVVTPLVSLMADQIKNLRGYGVRCAMINSSTSKEEVAAIEKDVASGHPRNRLLYITPERLTVKRFVSLLAKTYSQRELTRLVVDEAHCICEHGLSFRPDYQLLGNFRDQFPHVPIMALTASAPPAMRESIVDSLGMDERYLLTVVHPFNRPNIFYEIRYLSEEEDTPQIRMADIYDFIDKLYKKAGDRALDGQDARARPISGIIYARNRDRCTEVANYLKKRGINAAAYHKARPGLSEKELRKAQAAWSNADELAKMGQYRVDVIVATIAFGLGIDKPNTRFVIHYDLPKSMEGFYQETGRAGRDGHASRTILYFSREDAFRVANLVDREFRGRWRKADQLRAPEPSQRGPQSISALVRYCEDPKTCRHVAICRYFGEKVDQSDAERLCQRFCDVCKDPKRTLTRFARLSSDHAISSQVPKLYTQIDAEEVPEPDQGEETALSGPADDEQVEVAPPRSPPASDEADSAQAPAVDARSVADVEDSDSDGDVPMRDLPAARPSAKSLGKRRATDKHKPAFAGDRGDDDDLPDAWDEVRPAAKEAAPPPRAAVRPAKDLNIFKKPALPPSRTKAGAPAPRFVLQPQGLNAPAARPDHGFKTPFSDASKRNPEKNPERLAAKNKRSSSPNATSHSDIVLIPDTWVKPLPAQLRRSAVESFHKHLVRATLTSDGGRTGSEEAAIWRALHLTASRASVRREVVLRAAIEMETDLFFLAATPQGYRDRFERRKDSIRALFDSRDWIPTLSDPSKRDDLLTSLVRAARLFEAGCYQVKTRVDEDEMEE